jgi:hypothetical protein
MNIKAWILWVGLGLLANVPASAQGTFQNLDFESATIVFVPGDPNQQIEFGPALPGWTGYVGTSQLTAVLYNDLFLSGGGGISLWGPNYPSPNLFHGQYFVTLQGAFPDGVPPAAITQMGRIPSSAQSLTFYARASLQVTFAGQALPLHVLGGSLGTYYVYGVDVGPFAGQTGELRFSGSGSLDYIQFSSQPIPEPNAITLFLTGSAFWFAWRRRRLWT